MQLESGREQNGEENGSIHKKQKVEEKYVKDERLEKKDEGNGSGLVKSWVERKEEEVSSDSDIATESMDLMTPFGKRILRERPVKPTTKAKEMHWQLTARGRGNRGRGRGGSG
ncbi:unnamed protein product [Microthlaspi erraticum]|uniref:Uncharacterized protein n=1 Tax=Microthlaspi erraticum TaxID=1685480 RepID=A0A6D2IMF1_9BRAS|nr:unnamed protein product [Microthlaspi erraticum]